MIYLDYSATTPVKKEVLDTFVKVCQDYIGNPNSLHRLGVESHRLMNTSIQQIADLLHVKPKEVICTSSASEANNLAIQGIIHKYHRGKVILTTEIEHSSVHLPIQKLEEQGYTVSYIKLLDNGRIDLNDLKEKMSKEVLLVSICYVNSEVGICQDISTIGQILKEYPLCFFHVDGTQAVGKIPVDLTNIDLFSFSAHKFYGLKGIAALIKKENVELEPLIYGGKSQTIYRSGTPALPLIVSMAKALRLALMNLDDDYKIVSSRCQLLLKSLTTIEGVMIHHNDVCLPHIVNISIPHIKSEVMVHALEMEDIFVSTKTACSSQTDLSQTLLALGKSKEVSSTSLRISISKDTTEDDILKFLKILKQKIKELNFKNGE